ncbi:MAG: choice-of-anchor L domain-containing protein [Bacteroidota bacterium]
MRYLLHSLLLFMTNLAFGQLSTNTSLSPNALVQNVLLGPGVQVSNIQYTGDFQAIGQFNYAGGNLGLTQGIVITTGTVFNTGEGPQGPNDDGGSGIDNSGGSSAILNSILGSNNTFNAAVLQFDFTAVGDIVSFNYIFGSEEYLEYVDAGFNDVFGLFISGPGIVGTQNIAKLPNQAVVSIDNVNDNSNSAFYVDNGDGNDPPYDSNPQFIQYDGYTRVLTASSPVQCGQTYHLTIAIADVGDGILDSGIFLEAQSLTSEAPTEISFESSQNFFGDPSIIAEGCTSGEFTFTRTNTEDPLSVPIILTGTAQNGSDYTSTIPGSLNLAAGQASAVFSFDAILDELVEGDETIILTFQVPDLCNGINEEDFTITIRDVEPITVSLAADTIFCEDPNTITLTPVMTGGLAPITFQWSTGETTPTINVTPTQTTVYSVTVTDFCLNSTATDDAEIYIPPVVPIIIQPIADVTEVCPFITQTFTAQASGGTGSTYNYQWQLSGAIIGTNPSIQITPSQTGTYDLFVSDLCGASSTTSFTYTVVTPLLIPEINTPAIICPGDSVLLTASATLGFGEYSYDWSHTQQNSPNVWVTPLETTTYNVSVSDACQTYSVPIETTVPVYVPNANFTFNSSSLDINSEIQFVNTTANGVSYSWNLGNGESSTLENPSAVYPDIGEYIVTLIAVDAIGCIDTVSKVINIGSTIYIPNTFTPDGNRFNNEFEPVGYNMKLISFEIYNRWGELIFEATGSERMSWDGTYKGRPCPDGVYTYKVRYREPNQDEFVKVGHVTLMR